MVDRATEEHIASYSEKAELVDTVSYKFLLPGHYVMSGVLMDKESGKALVDKDGKEIVASAEFDVPVVKDEFGNPKPQSGSVKVVFTLDTRCKWDWFLDLFGFGGDLKTTFASTQKEFDEAVDFFQNVPSIRRKLETLNDVGLSYIRLGQPSTQLSGGEAQRIKLATELSRRSTGRTIYILDEPTTGLHFADVHKLTDILHRLAAGGNSVVVIEHNLDVIKTADYIIDLGPDGGDRGGTLVACGTPEEVAQCEQSYTGQYLKKILEKAGRL